jgi:hypothetical protein
MESSSNGVSGLINKRIHSYAPRTIINWMNDYHRSRNRPKAHLGGQSLFAYFPSFNFSNGWCSIDELLSGPDYKIPGNRSHYKIDAYMPLTYVRWMDKMSGKAIDYLDDASPDNLARIKEQYGDRLSMVRDHSMHLKRAIIIYYKLASVNPAILQLDLDLIRPSGYEDRYHCFQDIDYTIAYSNKLARLIGVDLSRPPKISLTDY